ncbi:MAG: hydantoinase/oxoprolinase family protein, partial [Anaerolineales bacterium]
MQIGIDIGGTFTDFVFYDESGRLHTFKILSTPRDPAEAVLDGLQRLSRQYAVSSRQNPDPNTDDGSLDTEHWHVVHGSTIATNTLLERTGARTAFVTTRGFRDMLTIGRQNREHIYDFFADRPEPLVPPERCFAVDERVDYQGKVLRPLADDELSPLAAALQAAGVESVAISLLFSFHHPAHEERIAEVLQRAGFEVSRSSEVLPEFREYERASTTVINAYVGPRVAHYLARLAEHDSIAELRVMQSNGGSLRADKAGREAVRTILSGPAGGVVGAVRIARAAGLARVITFDMGGTSTDVSLSEGSPRVTTEAAIGGLPVRVPVIDIHTVGAGGGSIGAVDAGGALRVGPQSAGADPGPACYGRGGTAPTVTDANVVLGRLAADEFLGGGMALDPTAAEQALTRLAEAAGLGGHDGLSPGQLAALGMVAVANAHMARALRVISVERGYDPRDFVLISFGGAGGLHACELARSLGIRRVFVPPGASTLSAYGMLAAD